MTKVFLTLLILTNVALAQSDFIGRTNEVVTENGVTKIKTVLTPLPNPNGRPLQQIQHTGIPVNPLSNSSVRWSYQEPAGIGDYCLTSGNGKYCAASWNLNNKRISFYNNLNATPLWEYNTDPNGYLSFISVSDTGGVLAVGSYLNIFLFNNSGNVPFFNFDLTQLPDTGTATALDLTRDGRFLVASVSRQDSSTVYGFNTNSTSPVWKLKIVPNVTAGGAALQGIRISGNDSLVIVNTYSEVWVLNTYTGVQRYRGLINPGNPNSGTQAAQGISGNGNYIATINYTGLVTLYQWNGSTYNLVWVNQEPPGQFYNWYTAVDFSYDGEYLAAGTLNFITSSSYDGKVKVFKRTSSTPQWTFTGAGDEVTNLSFSRSGNILAASSWGEFNNLTDDIYIFKTFMGNIPIFKVNTPGSMLYCSTSNDGRSVVMSGKAVHARQFGNGGLLYNIDVDTSDIPVSVSGNITGIASDYKLYQNYPNPFNPVTKIRFEIPDIERGQMSSVKLVVYNSLGKELQTLFDGNLNPGSYEVNFNADNYSSGIYFYKLFANGHSETRQMALIR